MPDPMPNPIPDPMLSVPEEKLIEKASKDTLESGPLNSFFKGTVPVIILPILLTYKQK